MPVELEEAPKADTAGAAVVTETADPSAATVGGDAEPAVVALAPITLTLPEGVTDDALVQRIVADATARGLTPEAAQAMLDARLEERTTQTAEYAALVEAWKPGGAEWVKRDSGFKAALLADPDLGGSQEKVNLALERGQLVLATFGGDDAKAFLDETGLGSHPVVVKMLAKIGERMSESLILPQGRQPKVGKTAADILYPAAPKGA